MDLQVQRQISALLKATGSARWQCYADLMGVPLEEMRRQFMRGLLLHMVVTRLDSQRDGMDCRACAGGKTTGPGLAGVTEIISGVSCRGDRKAVS